MYSFFVWFESRKLIRLSLQSNRVQWWMAQTFYMKCLRFQSSSASLIYIFVLLQMKLKWNKLRKKKIFPIVTCLDYICYEYQWKMFSDITLRENKLINGSGKTNMVIKCDFRFRIACTHRTTNIIYIYWLINICLWQNIFFCLCKFLCD